MVHMEVNVVVVLASYDGIMFVNTFPCHVGDSVDFQ